MTRTIAALLAAATLAGIAAPAAAQTKYTSMATNPPQTDPPAASEPTYVPTYSSYYGACVNGLQTAPISSCKDGDGRTVSNALCPSRSEPKACTQPSCDIVQSGYSYGNASFNSIGRASNAQDATNMCSKAMAPGKKGGCHWNSSNNGEGPVTLLVGNNMQVTVTSNPNIWVARCS
jgi:hypothetical protein